MRMEKIVGEEWIAATMGAAMGQMWILPRRPDLPEPHWIRIRDAMDSRLWKSYLCHKSPRILWRDL